MSATFDKVRPLIRHGDWRASDHALQRMSDRGILGSDLADTIDGSVVIEDSPDFHAGPCVLLLQSDSQGPVHALWGLEKGTDRPAVLITAYRPAPAEWHDDNRTRRS